MFMCVPDAGWRCNPQKKDSFLGLQKKTQASAGGSVLSCNPLVSVYHFEISEGDSASRLLPERTPAKYSFQKGREYAWGLLVTWGEESHSRAWVLLVSLSLSPSLCQFIRLTILGVSVGEVGRGSGRGSGRWGCHSNEVSWAPEHRAEKSSVSPRASARTQRKGFFVCVWAVYVPHEETHQTTIHLTHSHHKSSS